ncbi:hypothetical protein BCR39DRAFT_525741 [Naematelia encephala]|uniref:Beach-domain-containing protein n=1 Tax=Naematelia encephala TaxID=71784 RepID=A0A1Y2BAI4_9TREE|nr:hypothetical protein BCR39DRAFT_525741 [Naematelia encephala]
MFKLLKELTRPPEPLIPPPQAHTPPSQPTYTARQRAKSPSPAVQLSVDYSSRSSGAAAVGSTGTTSTRVEPVAIKEVEETDELSVKVVELVKALEGSGEGGVMQFVETFSQVLSIPSTTVTRRAFHRHRGFEIFTEALNTGLAYRESASDIADEERQVEEVQRVEGIRLAFEVLSWALGDRDAVAAFERAGGYISLLPVLRKLAKTPLEDQASTRIASEEPSTSSASSVIVTPQLPQPANDQILAQLLSHIFDNNYNILSVFAVKPSSTEDLTSKLGELNLRWPQALPLLWAYLWRLDESAFLRDSAKGKARALPRDSEACAFGSLDVERDESHLIDHTLRLILGAAHASTVNMLLMRAHMPDLVDFLILRLYGPAKQRHYEVTFPPRDDWFVRHEEDDGGEGVLKWKPPPPYLRETYLALLRVLLQAGVSQAITWRLFSLVKMEPKVPNGGTSTPRATAPLSGHPSSDQLPEQAQSAGDVTPKPVKKRPRPGVLTLPTEDKLDYQADRLNTEVLDLIKHTMKHRFPPSFVFRGGSGDTLGGLEMRDLGRSWCHPHKGFNFSCWVNISKLNHPITLLHVSQVGAKRPLFRIRILENTQIALYSSVYTAPSEEETSVTTETPEADVDEIVCSAPDALIPHGQWVHFAVGCRKPKGLELAETRIFVNGVRVGALRMRFPVPIPSVPPTSGPQLNAKPSVPLEAIRISIGREYDISPGCKAEKAESMGRTEENEWMLGRTLLLEEAVPEDLVLLMHHLGPRYNGNFQEPLGKFLTYEAATSINVYLSALAQAASDKRLFTLPANSLLVRAIRQGPAFPEEAILLSLAAGNVLPSRPVDAASAPPSACVNSAVPHPFRARQLRHGTARIVGSISAFEPTPLDDSVSTVGGGVVVLKMVDMAQTTDELSACLSILKDMIKDSWSASEEMERIRGFETLAAILRPKMGLMVDVICAKIILSMLGVNMDKPGMATVHNSVAYRALGLEFELWSLAPLGVTSLYLQHFEYLLQTSKHSRFNLLRTFQKSAMVRKLLYALRSNLFEPSVVPVVVDTLKLALLARWSAEDAIKPVFSYLISALCQANSAFTFVQSDEPPPSQVAAASILAMMAELCHNKVRLVKLNKSIALHRLLVIFLSSNPAYYVVLPCLDILERCLTTPGLEGFQRSFEAEGGFALMARTIGPLWRTDVQAPIFRMMMGPAKESHTLHCPNLLSSVLAALDFLLQAAGETDDTGARPSGVTRTRSGTITSVHSIGFSPLVAFNPNGNENGNSSVATDRGSRLEALLVELTATYRASHALRRVVTARRIEAMLPSVADYAAISAASGNPDEVKPQRRAVAQWLQALIELGKLPSALLGQIRLIQEQLRSSMPSPRLPSGSFAMSPPSPRPSSSFFGSSLSGRFGSTPPGSPASLTPRRRPSADAGFILTRSRSSIMEKRTPLKRVLTGESILEGGKDKNAAWKLIIIQTDSQSHAKMTLERKEHWHRLSTSDWPKQASALRAENGLWPDQDGPVTWRLDGSEGPLRMRNRLERISAMPEQGMARTRSKLRDAIPSVDELSSAVSRVNVAPWEDPFSLALGQAAAIEEEEPAPTLPSAPSVQAPSSPGADSRIDDESFVEVEENKDDKMRRIAKTLEAGDVVEVAHNIVRIIGVDACPGLLILGKKNLYLVDGLVQTPDGEVIDARDAPRDSLLIPSGTLVELDSLDQQSHRWSYNEIVENNKRAFLFRDVALELYFSDKRNFLIVFADKNERQKVASKLSHKADQSGTISRSVVGTFVLDQMARGLERSEQQLEAATRKWQGRELSNFAYLQLLNQFANRTPNDVTQYPVFPWVLADYTSLALSLDKSSTFRDLTHPMGALTEARREAAMERYSATEGVGEKPFHYGTHYSSSMIVCGFMIRLSPFTEIFLALQGGNFDLADRLFSSIPKAWDSASSDNRGDVRELIPEFYYSAAFLRNINRHDFGKKQVSGDSVDNVALPPWALNDPLLFVHRHREALESEFVSRHLPYWIDLTFGYKQRDPASFNCFHPLSYRGAVDLEHMEDESEKAASTAIIHNFGQTPLQIFKTPHPHRFLHGQPQLPVGARFGVAEHWQLLFRSILPITETTTPINDIVPPPPPSDLRPAPQQRHRLVVPGTHLSVQFGFTDGSLRVYYQQGITPHLVHLVEGISVSRAVFAAPAVLMTLSDHGVLTAWSLTIRGSGSRRGEVTLHREATLRGHAQPVTCLAASVAWSLLVSGSEVGIPMASFSGELTRTGWFGNCLGHESNAVHTDSDYARVGADQVLCNQRVRRPNCGRYRTPHLPFLAEWPSNCLDIRRRRSKYFSTFRFCQLDSELY